MTVGSCRIPAVPTASSTFRWTLAAICTAGLVLRLVYGLLVAPGTPLGGDASFFIGAARNLAEGHGYANPYITVIQGVYVPTAEHPPLYSLWLYVPIKVGLTSLDALHIWTSLLGIVTVGAIGMAGRRLGGERIGLLAAAIAAVYPLFVMIDGSLYSEAVYIPCIAVVVWMSLRLAGGPSVPSAAALGAAVALAALARSEALLLIVLLIPAVVWCTGGRRVIQFVAAGLACAVFLGPWLVRNAEVFGRPVVSTNLGVTLRGSNCPLVYRGPLMGLWNLACNADVPTVQKATPEETIEAHDAALNRAALDYVGDNLGRLPVVLLARVGRTFDLFRPRQNANYEQFVDGRNFVWSIAALPFYYSMLALAVLGAISLRRRRLQLWILVTPVILSIATTLAFYGVTRLRAAADVSLILFAALGLRVLWRWRGRVLVARLTPSQEAAAPVD